MNGARVPAPDVDSYQRLEKRSHRQVWTDRDGGSERPRQGFDGFDELLTTCAAVNRLLVVEGTALPKERNSRKVLTERSMRTGPVQEGMSRVNRWRRACTL
jgi:hypothetical protein